MTPEEKVRRKAGAMVVAFFNGNKISSNEQFLGVLSQFDNMQPKQQMRCIMVVTAIASLNLTDEFLSTITKEEIVEVYGKDYMEVIGEMFDIWGS